MRRFIKYIKRIFTNIIGNLFFHRHKWTDFKFRNFDEPKMDDKGRMSNKMLIRTCGKCSKMELFALR